MKEIKIILKKSKDQWTLNALKVKVLYVAYVVYVVITLITPRKTALSCFEHSHILLCKADIYKLPFNFLNISQK